MKALRAELDRLKKKSPRQVSRDPYPRRSMPSDGNAGVDSRQCGYTRCQGARGGFWLFWGVIRSTFQHGSGRLELAHAIASADNPLTARVMVNRIWQHHFGRGLVALLSNFGTLGERPSHPELLDWLAHRFIASGWSIKAMHRDDHALGDLSTEQPL